MRAKDLQSESLKYASEALICKIYEYSCGDVVQKRKNSKVSFNLKLPSQKPKTLFPSLSNELFFGFTYSVWKQNTTDFLFRDLLKGQKYWPWARFSQELEICSLKRIQANYKNLTFFTHHDSFFQQLKLSKGEIAEFNKSGSPQTSLF